MSDSEYLEVKQVIHAMSTTIYCYHCRTSHPKEDMRQVVTKTGRRWRCIYSIRAAKVDRAKREEFGRQITERNKAEALARARMVVLKD